MIDNTETYTQPLYSGSNTMPEYTSMRMKTRTKDLLQEQKPDEISENDYVHSLLENAEVSL